MGPLALQCLINGVYIIILMLCCRQLVYSFLFFFLLLFIFWLSSIVVSVVSFFSLASTQEIQECLKEYITLEDAYLTYIDRNYENVCNILSVFF